MYIKLIDIIFYLYYNTNMSEFMKWFTDTVIDKMKNRLRLFLVEVPNTPETAYISYDDVIGFVVALYSEEEARNFNPQTGAFRGWVKAEDRHLLSVREIGYAADDVKVGEIFIRDVIEG